MSPEKHLKELSKYFSIPEPSRISTRLLDEQQAEIDQFKTAALKMLACLKKFKVSTADPMKEDFDQSVNQFDEMQDMFG